MLTFTLQHKCSYFAAQMFLDIDFAGFDQPEVLEDVETNFFIFYFFLGSSAAGSLGRRGDGALPT
jgi:hypothetical protein